ncbi:MAG: energy-coupling factor ABC transporter permease [Desulfobacterales bacterium]|nr:energy-coupling factor ABC transporter permease [Desulfobacterales bacterium]
MHMADALLSPPVGGLMWAGSIGLIAYCSKKAKDDLDERRIPLMGVLGAFVFAAQMVTFAIPGTGSGGHLGGGLLLAVLVGPFSAFLTMASILTIQALFFGDGGLLALGCNIFNLGFFPAFIAYPFFYRKIAGQTLTRKRLVWASLAAAIVSVQMGAFGVVLQTVFSGLAELPFKSFVLLMQPIHLAIGLTEGLVTAGVIIFVSQARPEILIHAAPAMPPARLSVKAVLCGFLLAAMMTGGVFSWFSSSRPDGLEWAILRVTGTRAPAGPQSPLHLAAAALQTKTALLPDYGFKPAATQGGLAPGWSPADSGTTVSGLVGSALTLMMAALIGLVLRKRKN